MVEVILAISKGLFVGFTIASLFGVTAYLLLFPWTAKQLMIKHGGFFGDRSKYRFWQKVYYSSKFLYTGLFIGMFLVGLGSLLL